LTLIGDARIVLSTDGGYQPRVTESAGGARWVATSFQPSCGSGMLAGRIAGNYALPIKKSIRRVEGIAAGDVVTVKLRTIER
jgi:hypothetical protein